MKLIRWTPYRSLVSLPNELDRFFDNFGLDFRNTDTVWNPVVDISENKNSYVVKAEVPGISKNDIKISYEDDMLTLSGERKFEKEDNEKNYHRIERSFGKFERSFQLPNLAKPEPNRF